MEQNSTINIAYYRVSTKKQETSGLGLDAQKNMVFGFLKKEPDFEYIETESGKNSGRIQLKLAIEKTKKIGGRLVIAKLDRLSRNVNFISNIMESKVDFVCCDNPNATKFTLHILAAVAEFEAEMISKRTKEGLAAKVRREIESGNVNFKLGRKTPLTDEDKKASMLARLVNIENNSRYLKAAKFIERKFKQGIKVSQIVYELKLDEIETVQGCLNWTPMQVFRIIDRLNLRENVCT